MKEQNSSLKISMNKNFKIKYYVFNPIGNITALVETPVKTELQPFVASRLMELEPTVEQVGFVNGKSLRMAGGEFCGNASMSAAVLYLMNKNATVGETHNLSLSVSGVDNSVDVWVEKISDNSFNAKVQMPKALSVTKEKLYADGTEYNSNIVRFQGITHIIPDCDIDKNTAEKAIKQWCGQLKSEALGIMIFNESTLELKPLVFVPDADTLFWESSCSSGTAAVARYLSFKNGKRMALELKEPGGVVFAEASGDGITVGCTVLFVKSCNAEI